MPLVPLLVVACSAGPGAKQPTAQGRITFPATSSPEAVSPSASEPAVVAPTTRPASSPTSTQTPPRSTAASADPRGDTMCSPNPGARCVSRAAATTWWGSPLLAPRDGVADFVLQHHDGRFGPGDAERYVPSSIVLVLALGGVGARDGDKFAVLDAGGVTVMGIRQTTALAPDKDNKPVRVRGHIGTVGEITAVMTRTKYRIVSWRIADGGHILVWNVIDSGRHRTLDQLVAIVNALDET